MGTYQTIDPILFLRDAGPHGIGKPVVAVKSRIIPHGSNRPAEKPDRGNGRRGEFIADHRARVIIAGNRFVNEILSRARSAAVRAKIPEPGVVEIPVIRKTTVVPSMRRPAAVLYKGIRQFPVRFRKQIIAD
jgi:hypothetical protein